ncbi:hypothetical protein CENSYa_0274 [Cenarchaeum symbiosum A]|uniref:Uncharacterized protein n=1 Tax=Cenarchaeum symbiosum (strain A) TaxID=414004 RepID=A0RU97_CENSY|nr:hypothetical protein CENSYa_0274 [Cenarchaeum symbiosum A]
MVSFRAASRDIKLTAAPIASDAAIVTVDCTMSLLLRYFTKLARLTNDLILTVEQSEGKYSGMAQNPASRSCKNPETARHQVSRRGKTHLRDRRRDARSESQRDIQRALGMPACACRRWPPETKCRLRSGPGPRAQPAKCKIQQAP